MELTPPKSPYLFLDKSPLQSMLTTLGKYMLGIEVSHSTGKPQPVLKLLFPADWLIPEDPRFIVEADFFSNDETLYFMGPDPENGYITLDDAVRYADGIIKYNDTVEAKRLELEELLRLKEAMLAESIFKHREKMEAEGVKFRSIVPKRPQVAEVLSKTNTIKLAKDTEISAAYDAQYANFGVPVVARKSVPEGFDPAIFTDEDEPVDPRELIPEQQSQERVVPIEEDDLIPQRPQGGNGGLTIVKPQPNFNRDQVIMQRHDRDDNY